MKRWIWMLAMPYVLWNSSTTPTYKTLEMDGDVVFNCAGHIHDDQLPICNLLAESFISIARISYERGGSDARKKAIRQIQSAAPTIRKTFTASATLGEPEHFKEGVPCSEKSQESCSKLPDSQ